MNVQNIENFMNFKFTKKRINFKVKFEQKSSSFNYAVLYSNCNASNDNHKYEELELEFSVIYVQELLSEDLTMNSLMTMLENMFELIRLRLEYIV